MIRKILQSSAGILLLIWFGLNACQKEEIQSREDPVMPAEDVYIQFVAAPAALQADMDEEVFSVKISSIVDTLLADYTLVSYPDWIRTSIDGSDLTVTVTASVAAREGEIVVRQAISDSMLTIPVSQRYIDFPDVETNAAIPAMSGRLFLKDFTSVGYGTRKISAQLLGRTLRTCSDPEALTSNTKPFQYEEQYYDDMATEDFTIAYTDAGLFFNCSDISDAGKGYVLFNNRRARNGEARASVVIEERPSVSVARFTISATSTEGRGLALFQSVGGDRWEPVGIFKPSEADSGEVFTVPIYRANVAFKFAPYGENEGYYRLHDLALYTIPFAHDGRLIIDDHFQEWGMVGYVNSSDAYCDRILLASGQMQTFNINRNYSNWLVEYQLNDGGINSYCGSDAGTSTPDSEVSTGYCALQAPIYYACGGHATWASLRTRSALPSVSRVKFSFAYSLANIEDVYGITFFKKSKADADWVKIGDYTVEGSVEEKTAGKTVEVDINEENVYIGFVATFPLHDGEDVTPMPQGGSKASPGFADYATSLPNNIGVETRQIRIHDLQVWCMEK